MKLKFSTSYQIPSTINAIAITVLIPRKILVEHAPEFNIRDRRSIPLELMTKILEESEYEPYNYPIS